MKGVVLTPTSPPWLRPCLVWSPKNGLHVSFCKPWVPFFEVKQRWAPFIPGFSGIFLRFSANQNFGVCAWTTSTPTSSTTALHNSLIGNFMANQDWLETNLLQLFGHPENSKWFSKNFVIILEVGIVDEQKQTYSVAIYLFFTSFHCPQLFYCFPCPTAT